MQKIDSETSLRSAILQLESRREDEEKMLKEQFLITYESIKPVNLFKSTFRDLVANREVKNDLVSTSVGLATGYLGKILVGSVTRSPFKRLLGSLAMIGITRVVARNPDIIQSLGKGIFKMIRGRPNGKVHPS